MGMLDDFRAKNPAYKDTPDDKLSDGLYNKFYAGKMSRDDFNQKTGSSTQSAAPAQQPLAQPQQKPVIQAPLPTVQNQPVQPSFMDRVQQDWRNKVGESQKMDANPAPTGAEDILQRTGKLGASFVNDVAGEAAKSAYGMLPEDFKEKVSGGLKMAMDSPAGKMGLDMVKRGADVYQKWAAQNPRVAKDLEAVVDIGSAIPAGMGVGKAAVKAAPMAAEATLLPTAGRVAKGLSMPGETGLQKISKNLYDKSQSTANDIKNSSVKYKPDIMQKLDKGLNDIISGVKGEEAERAKDIIDSIDRFKEQNKTDTSLKNLFMQRKTLGELASSGGETGDIARKALKHYDTILEKSPIKQFNKEYQQFKTHETLMDLVDPGEGKSALSSNQIKGKASKLVDSDGFKYLDNKTQELVKQVARGKTSGNILGAANKIKDLFKHGGTATGLGTIGAAVMGHPGVAAAGVGVLAGSEASRQIAKGTVWDAIKANMEIP